MKFPALLVLLLDLVLGSLSFRLTVLHTNDLHSRFDQVTASGSECHHRGSKKCYGGVARIKYAVDQLRKEYPNSVFLNAGDFFQGTVWYSMFKWRVVANMTSSLGYTASSLGNHEFDDGLADLEAFTAAIQDSYPLLACNIDTSQVPILAGKIKPYIITTVGRQKIAILGYVTPDTKELSNTGNIIFQDEIQSLQRTVAQVQRKGVNIIIAVGHSGYERDLEIAKEVDGIDIMIGGHTNTFLWNGDLPPYVKHSPVGSYPTVVNDKVLVVQTNGYGRYLGQLHVTFDEDGNPLQWEGNPLLLNDSYAEDSHLLSLVNTYREKVVAKMGTAVGATQAYIDGGRPKCRIEECSFGNFVTDAMASEMGVKIAVINSGAIKGSFDPAMRNGTITMHDIYTAMPWSNTIDVVTISGAVLLSVLEHSVSSYKANDPDPGGRFLQVSGLLLTYDVRQPVGQRLVSAYLGQPGESRRAIQNEALYEVAVPSFLAAGGDLFTMIPESLVEYKNTGFLDNDLMVAYLQKHNPLRLPAAGRIVMLADNDKLLASSAVSQHPMLSPTFMLWMYIFLSNSPRKYNLF